MCEPAQHSLRARLAAVEYFLPLAAERAGEGVEFVHELRGVASGGVSLGSLRARNVTYARSILAAESSLLGKPSRLQ